MLVNSPQSGQQCGYKSSRRFDNIIILYWQIYIIRTHETAFIYRFPCNLVVRCFWYLNLCLDDSFFGIYDFLPNSPTENRPSLLHRSVSEISPLLCSHNLTYDIVFTKYAGIILLFFVPATCAKSINYLHPFFHSYTLVPYLPKARQVSLVFNFSDLRPLNIPIIIHQSL